MKMCNLLVSCLFGLLFFTVQGWAGNHTVSVAWDHGLPTDLAKFELRVNGDNDTLVQIEPDVLMWKGVLVINDDNNVFDLRACDLSGQCSIWSEPCDYDPEPLPPTLKCGELIIDASANGDSVDIHIRWAAQRK